MATTKSVVINVDDRGNVEIRTPGIIVRAAEAIHDPISVRRLRVCDPADHEHKGNYYRVQMFRSLTPPRKMGTFLVAGKLLTNEFRADASVPTMRIECVGARRSVAVRAPHHENVLLWRLSVRMAILAREARG